MEILRNMDVLLVEDDEIDAENVRRLLPGDTMLKRATTLRAALALIDGSPLDLILLDPGLPDSSGEESFRRIRESAPKIPVVVFTGLGDERVALNIIREGAQDYLLKNQLDERALQAVHFAVERGRLLLRLEEEQAERERLVFELREQERSQAHLGRVALMGEVVAEVTHEVSQPLNVISTLAGALKASLQQDELDTSRHLNLIDKLFDASVHAGEILSRLREFIRDGATTFANFDMNDLILSTTEFVDSERGRRKIEIRHEFDEKEAWAFGNRTQIQQVIVNLMRNAFDAMAQTPESDRIVTLCVSASGENVRVEVVDQGSGLNLDPADVFAPFKTTKNTGLGMGLAICSRIIHNHHGQIAVVPSDLPGTVFRFEIPSA